MCYRGFSNWPPVWVEKFGTTKLNGEIGTLVHLGRNEKRAPNVLYLHINYDGIPYCGSLLIDNSAFRDTVYEILEKHLGDRIKDIGGLDVSYTL